MAKGRTENDVSPIGKIRVLGVSVPDVTEATMYSDGRWRSEDARLAEMLNLMFVPPDTSPWRGIPGLAELHRAADAFGGIAEIDPSTQAEIDNHDPNIVY